jgi:hypothetical protein
MDIKILVTVVRFDEVIDLADSFNLGEVNTKRAFEYLCEFVVDENGEYIGADKARELFKIKRVKRGEIGAYWGEFVNKVVEAFVSPPSGAA